MVLPYELFGQLDFKPSEIFNETALVLLPEKFLKLGTPDEVCPADLVNGQMFADMFFQVSGDPLINDGIVFLLDGFDNCRRCAAAFHLLSHKVYEELLQIKLDELF